MKCKKKKREKKHCRSSNLKTHRDSQISNGQIKKSVDTRIEEYSSDRHSLSHTLLGVYSSFKPKIKPICDTANLF